MSEKNLVTRIKVKASVKNSSTSDTTREDVQCD